MTKSTKSVTIQQIQLLNEIEKQFRTSMRNAIQRTATERDRFDMATDKVLIALEKMRALVIANEPKPVPFVDNRPAYMTEVEQELQQFYDQKQEELIALNK